MAKKQLNSARVEELFGSGGASEVTLHSGNIASWSKLRRKKVLTTTEELVSAAESILKSWLGRQAEGEAPPSVVIRNVGLSQRVSVEERSNHLFTIKIFLTRWDGSFIHTALDKTLSELGIDSADRVILSLPPCTEDQLTLENMKPLWQHMERLARDGLTKVIGVADLNKAPLQELFDWATVKPKVNQMNLAHCCTIPEDLVEFTKTNGIDLFTHNDEREMISETQLQKTLTSTLSASSGRGWPHWRHSWVARYSSIVLLRGIISHKGYLIGLQRT